MTVSCPIMEQHHHHYTTTTTTTSISSSSNRHRKAARRRRHLRRRPPLPCLHHHPVLLLFLLLFFISTTVVNAFHPSLWPRPSSSHQQQRLVAALLAQSNDDDDTKPKAWFGDNMWGSGSNSKRSGSNSSSTSTTSGNRGASPSPSSSSSQPSPRHHAPNRRHNKGKKEWERSAPEEFLLILTSLRAQYGQVDVDEEGDEYNDQEEVERDIGSVINLVRALVRREWEQAEESASLLCESPLLDTVLSRMVVYAATQKNEPDLALAILGGMHDRRIDVDAFMASLVAKAAATDRRWMPVVEVIRAQLSVNPSGGMPTTRKSRRHEGFTQALASTIERGKFYSSSFLVDALLQFRMVDLFTAKIALKFYRFSRTPAKALPWIATAKAIGLIPDADLDFEVGRVYKSLGMWREAVALLTEMVTKKRTIEDEHVGVVLSTCHQAGEWQECMEVLNKMQEWNLRVGQVSYLIVLRLLLEKRRIDQARTVLEQMSAQGTPLDAETARLALFTLAKRGPVYSSMEFLKLMKTHHVEPDLVSYTAVLRGCARFQEPDRALEVLEMMQTKGIQPDVLACVTVMEALSGAARWDEAFALFDSCRAQGLKPDIKCWTQVLHQATNAGRWDLFPQYLSAAVGEARDHHQDLDLRFFATVINACAEANRTDEALAVLASVRSYGLTPNVYCYSAAAKSCLARNRWRDALALLHEAQDMNIPTDATLYRTVLRCCWQARQWKSVLGLYGEMLERGLEVDARMYNQLMDAVGKAGQTELASDLLQEMVGNGVVPMDGTLSAFFACWYVKGEYEVAWRVFDAVQMWEGPGQGERSGGSGGYDDEDEEEGIEGEEGESATARAPTSSITTSNTHKLTPGPTTFANLMSICSRREDWAEILKLKVRMDALGLLPSSAPHLVARAYAELGQWEKARRFVREEMVGEGGAGGGRGKREQIHNQEIEGSEEENDAVFELALGRAYGALLTLCSKRIEPTKALDLLHEMEGERGLVPDADAYHDVMDACAQAGMTQEVRAVFERMRRRPEILPRVESFTIMLELCAREGNKGEEALWLMDDLEGLGLTPDMLCFNAAMEACREAALLEGTGSGGGKKGGEDNKKEDEGGRFRAAMRKWRDVEVMHTYNSEMAVLATRKSVSNASGNGGGGGAGGSGASAAATVQRLLLEMEDNGIPRDTDSFNMALEACARAGDLPATRRVFDLLLRQSKAKTQAHTQGGGGGGGGGARPDIFSYITLANALVGEGYREEAMGLLMHMVSLSKLDDEADASAVAAVGVGEGGGEKEAAIKAGADPKKPSPGKGGKKNQKQNPLQAAATATTIKPSPPPSTTGIRKKTRWPAYYRNLWPQTAKTLSKTIVAFATPPLTHTHTHTDTAAGTSSPPPQEARCAEIGRLLFFLTTHLPILNTEAVAEQLVGKGLCTTEHIKTLTGNSLMVSNWRKEKRREG